MREVFKAAITAFLKWLSGKKGIILGMLALVVTYLFDDGLINSNMAYMFNGFLIILGGSASYATKKLVYPEVQPEVEE